MRLVSSSLPSPHYTVGSHYESEFFPLHLAAQYSENLELLQYLIQTNFAALAWTGEGHESNDVDENPLSFLIVLNDFPTYNSMLQCLLDANSDSDVIGLAIQSVMCYFGHGETKTDRILKLLEILLNANPSAGKYGGRHGDSHFSSIQVLKDPICANSVMDLLLVYYPLGIEVAAQHTDNGQHEQRFPIHTAVSLATVAVVKFMLQMYPAAIDNRAAPGLMHRAAGNVEDAEMMPYLCSIVPHYLHDRDRSGMTPLAYLCAGEMFRGRELSEQSRYARMLTMCETDPTIVRDEVPVRLSLPLHLLIGAQFGWGSPTSDFADCFRLLLRLHPSAAEAFNSRGQSPISCAILEGMDDYFIRLLLSRSTDAAHRALLSVYNYKHRRSLLFVSYFAISRCRLPTIFARLRQSHREALQVVASFL